MRRPRFAVLTIAVALLASSSYAGGFRGGLRYFGLHCGPGIHARNGCPGCYPVYAPAVPVPATYVDPAAIFMPPMPDSPTVKKGRETGDR